jgi:chain length determinant protein (polysaccharide antigen chain regulator)
METSSPGKLSGQRPIPVYIVPPADREDEVGLIDLWNLIARRKWVILSTLFASLSLAVLYLFFAQPVYKAYAHLLPPHQQDIQGLQTYYAELGDVDIERYTPESVYSAFLVNLQSKGLRREFFDTNGLARHYVSVQSEGNVNSDFIFDARFDANLRVLVPKDDPSSATASFSDADPERAAEWLNQIISFVNKRTIHQLLNDVNAEVKAEIKQVRYQLDRKLKLADEMRHDRIAQLMEASRIAKALGIEDASLFPKMADGTRAGLAVSTAQLPLYMRGTKALETEISVLESRKSDAPFISGFRDLQERRTLLEGLSIDTDSLSAVTVDEAARVPYKADKPSGKVLVLVLAATLGVIIGLLAIFALESWAKFSSVKSQSATAET